MNLSSDSLTQQMLQNLFWKAIETACLLKRDLNWWSRNPKWDLLTSVLMSFSNHLMLNEWIWDMFDYKKN